MGQLVFRGTVFSGNGAGKHFIELSWVKCQVERKVGFTPYLGTLNLRLTKEEAEKRKMLDPTRGIQIKPATGYFLGVLFRSMVEEQEAAVVVPVMPNYPTDVLEIIAPIYLRGKLKIEDGAGIVVTVTV
ncbi:MAG: CTP-dependent riboflavin kinase [Nitrososphaerota archaeon]|nr:CTP-dependent riboflavin kinase [Nitrososphaerota archaeon]